MSAGPLYSRCIIRDLTVTAERMGAIELDVLADTLISDLFQQVGKKVNYEPDSFQLILQKMGDGECMNLTEFWDSTVEGCGFRVAGMPPHRNQIMISELRSTSPRRSSSKDSSPSGGKCSPIEECESPILSE